MLLVDGSNNVLARGDLHIELEPNEWGHAFGLNFEGGPNGHPLTVTTFQRLMAMAN